MISKPHGVGLVDKILKGKEIDNALQKSKKLPAVILDEEDVKDVKNIARGVYSPLKGFMNKKDFEGTVREMRLSSGTLWPIPVILDVDRKKAEELRENSEIVLNNKENNPIAILYLREKYGYSKEEFAREVFKTLDPVHPGVEDVYAMGEVLLGGEIDLIDNSKEPFYSYNLDPKETRVLFKERGWETVAAFQTRNPPHMGHEYLQKCALEVTDGLFINPVIGRKKEGDFKDEVILKAYNALIKNYYPGERVVLSILPMQMRYAGPREAILHAIIRKNFGCTHFIIGRDHAGIGDFYDSYDAQKIFERIDVGIIPLRFENAFYCRICKSMATSKTCGHSEDNRIIPSGTRIRERIAQNRDLEGCLMRPEVIEAIKEFKDPYVK